jgi:hypothetical protein
VLAIKTIISKKQTFKHQDIEPSILSNYNKNTQILRATRTGDLKRSKRPSTYLKESETMSFNKKETKVVPVE